MVQPAAAASARAASEASRIACRMSLSSTRLADVAMRAHAGCVCLAILFVVLAVLVEPVERAAARADQAADGAILHGVHGLVTAWHPRGCLLVARGYDGLRGDRRRRRRGGSAAWSCPD